MVLFDILYFASIIVQSINFVSFAKNNITAIFKCFTNRGPKYAKSEFSIVSVLITQTQLRHSSRSTTRVMSQKTAGVNPSEIDTQHVAVGDRHNLPTWSACPARLPSGTLRRERETQWKHTHRHKKISAAQTLTWSHQRGHGTLQVTQSQNLKSQYRRG